MSPVQFVTLVPGCTRESCVSEARKVLSGGALSRSALAFAGLRGALPRSRGALRRSWFRRGAACGLRRPRGGRGLFRRGGALRRALRGARLPERRAEALDRKRIQHVFLFEPRAPR